MPTIRNFKDAIAGCEEKVRTHNEPIPPSIWEETEVYAMASVRSSTRFLRFWTQAGMILVLSTTVLLHAQSKPGQPVPTTQPAASPALTGEQKPAATQPASTAKPKPQATDASRQRIDPEPPREPSPTEILRELTKQANAPSRPIIRPTTPGRTRRTTISREAIPPNAIWPPQRKLLPDGYRIVDRPGRLIREGDYWVFSFESRGRGAPELPIRLLPNRLLEDMEVFSAGGTKPVVFVISGEITEYHNVNYLLVQKLLTRPDVGNLE